VATQNEEQSQRPHRSRKGAVWMGRQAARNCTRAIGEGKNKCKVKDPALANNGLGLGTRVTHKGPRVGKEPTLGHLPISANLPLG